MSATSAVYSVTVNRLDQFSYPRIARIIPTVSLHLTQLFHASAPSLAQKSNMLLLCARLRADMEFIVAPMQCTYLRMHLCANEWEQMCCISVACATGLAPSIVLGAQQFKQYGAEWSTSTNRSTPCFTVLPSGPSLTVSALINSPTAQYAIYFQQSHFAWKRWWRPSRISRCSRSKAVAGIRLPRCSEFMQRANTNGFKKLAPGLDKPKDTPFAQPQTILMHNCCLDAAYRKLW